jgi:hypothetical protein
MDLEVEEKEYYEVGETIKVDLISRLLVDEDASQRPGLKSVKVGDYSVSVPLAKTRWELRDLELSTNLLNDGVAFDPFFAPSNLELSNFSDSNGSDSGRNTDNVLDEAESIETVRKPCNVFGESDISCEFPDWMFSYEYTFETSDISDCFEINATDAFTIWKSEEFPAGSGSFQEFENVTNQFNEGGIDELCIKVRKKQKEFISGLVYPNPSTGVINIVSDLYSGTYEIYNLNGKLVKQGALNANQKIQLNVYPSGVYFAKLFDETEAEVQSIRFILNN